MLLKHINDTATKAASLHPSGEKTWTYDEITAATERGIQAGIELAKRHPADSTGNRFHKNVARGIYWGWYCLTHGNQAEGDAVRLKNLAEAA